MGILKQPSKILAANFYWTPTNGDVPVSRFAPQEAIQSSLGWHCTTAV